MKVHHTTDANNDVFQVVDDSADDVTKTFTIAAEAKPIGRNASGTTRWGPSGAGVWSSPTIDPKRRVLYAATGNMYTEPQQGTSDAIMALDLDSGAVRWTAQVTPKDVFVVGCNQPNPANCPAEVGPDFDFGSSPILARLPNGKDVIVDGQKSGVGWAFDPDARGAVLWQYRAAKGSALGGMTNPRSMRRRRISRCRRNTARSRAAPRGQRQRRACFGPLAPRLALTRLQCGNSRRDHGRAGSGLHRIQHGGVRPLDGTIAAGEATRIVT
jgi:hypothetical protein